jgi:bifunctional enzyme CysN/CysC
LLGRWLIEGGRVAADQISKVERICAEKGLPFEPAFLMDAFEEEQSQGVSIDSTRAQMEFGGQNYLFIDVPGHLEFLKNMTSGASGAELGILLIDAAEGVQAQTAMHLRILSILGIVNVVVAVNKIDKIAYQADKYLKLMAQAEELVQSLKLHTVGVVPIAALTGENVLYKGDKTNWYSGGSLLEIIAGHAAKRKASKAVEQFRMLLQDIYKLNDERYFLGSVVSGSVRPGDSIYFSPSGKSSKVESIAKFPNMQRSGAVEGESIAIKLTDQIYVERGEIISRPDQAPDTDSELRATIVWLSPHPLRFDSEYLFKIGTAEVLCTVDAIATEDAFNKPIVNGEILDVLLKLSHPVAFDRTGETGGINKFVICSTYETVAAGVIDSQNLHSIKIPIPNPNVRSEDGYLDRTSCEGMHGHKGTVLWLTGLSGAGKSTIAKALEKTLFQRQYRVMALDADNLRAGLCADLGFTTEERSENIRRIAEMAKFCANKGFIVVVACLSPYQRDRETARNIIGDSDFNEIFISCSVEVCKSRDPKGLYDSASKGTIKSFTGLDSPYQVPLSATLSLDSSQMSLEQEVAVLISLLKQKSIIEEASTEKQF